MPGKGFFSRVNISKNSCPAAGFRSIRAKVPAFSQFGLTCTVRLMYILSSAPRQANSYIFTDAEIMNLKRSLPHSLLISIPVLLIGFNMAFQVPARSLHLLHAHHHPCSLSGHGGFHGCFSRTDCHLQRPPLPERPPSAEGSVGARLGGPRDHCQPTAHRAYKVHARRGNTAWNPHRATNTARRLCIITGRTQRAR